MSEMTQNEVEDLILSFGSWESWASAYVGHHNVAVVERELDEGDDDRYDSAHEQGHEGACYIVFKVDGRFWRKTGATDSYANRNWNGKFREVSKGEVLVTKYEWREN
jgi:hypothetical protein